MIYIHLIALIIYGFGTFNAYLGFSLSNTTDKNNFIKKYRKKVYEEWQKHTKTYKQTAQTVISSSSVGGDDEKPAEVKPAAPPAAQSPKSRRGSVGLMMDKIQGLSEDRELTLLEFYSFQKKDYLEMFERRSEFRMSKLFILHLIFSVNGMAYLIMSVCGIEHNKHFFIQDCNIAIAASALFSGLWEVVVLWHRALPTTSLFATGKPKTRVEKLLENKALFSNMCKFHEYFFFFWFMMSAAAFPAITGKCKELIKALHRNNF